MAAAVLPVVLEHTIGNILFLRDVVAVIAVIVSRESLPGATALASLINLGPCGAAVRLLGREKPFSMPHHRVRPKLLGRFGVLG